MKSVDQLDSGKSSNNDADESSKSSLVVLRKHNRKQPSTFQLQTSICSYPGFGACELHNLGNIKRCFSLEDIRMGIKMGDLNVMAYPRVTTIKEDCGITDCNHVEGSYTR